MNSGDCIHISAVNRIEIDILSPEFRFYPGPESPGWYSGDSILISAMKWNYE